MLFAPFQMVVIRARGGSSKWRQYFFFLYEECLEGIAFRKGELPLPFVVKYDGHYMPPGDEKNSTDRNKTAREPRRHRAHHSKAGRRYGEATQFEDYGAQDTHDYDRDRMFPRGPSNNVQKQNNGNCRGELKSSRT